VLEEKKNLPPKVNYPPPVVRRVAVPRAFNVERIRDTSAPIPTEAENTQGEKKLETSSAVTAAAALAASAELKKKAVSPSEDSVNEALAGLGQEKSAPFDIAASQAAEKDPKTSPFEVASSQDSSKGTASVDQPSPFTIADSKESVAEVKKEQVKSPFKVAASEDSVEVSKKEEVSSFAVASAQPTSADVRKAAQASPFAAASPLQSSEQAFAEPQTAIPAARVSEPKQEEEALSPFEAARPPSVAPNMPFSPSPAPVENQPTQATTPASQSPFQVREEPAQAVEKSPFTVRSESSQKKSEDPLRANLAPKAVPPQPEVPKADADAIDELLRQFREHRDS